MSITFTAADTSSTQSDAAQRWLYAALSFGLVVLFPTVFWLGIAELSAMALDFSLGNIGRAILVTVLMGLLTVVWSVMRGISRDNE